MDYYAIAEVKVNKVREEIISSMFSVLREKGYAPGQTATLFADGAVWHWQWCSDRLLLNGTHPDNVSIEELMFWLRLCMHLNPKE